jgi:DNA-binding NarL/FixJ family response regulator
LTQPAHPAKPQVTAPATSSESVQVLLDLFMPGLDGIAVLKALQADGLASGVLVLTSSQDGAHLVQAIRAGALSYLPKTADVDQVVASVRAAARGESALQPAATARLLRELRRLGYQASGRRPASWEYQDDDGVLRLHETTLTMPQKRR